MANSGSPRARLDGALGPGRQPPWAQGGVGEQQVGIWSEKTRSCWSCGPVGSRAQVLPLGLSPVVGAPEPERVP